MDDKDNEFKNATTMSGLMLKYKKAKTNFQLQYQYTTQDRTYFNDSVDRTYTIFENNQYAGTTHFADAFLSTPIHKNVQWIMGTDFRYGSYNQSYESLGQGWAFAFSTNDKFQFQLDHNNTEVINLVKCDFGDYIFGRCLSFAFCRTWMESLD
jgi:hypothetical protein